MKTNSSGTGRQVELGTGDTGYQAGMLVMLIMVVIVVMLVMLVIVVMLIMLFMLVMVVKMITMAMRMRMMKTSRWAVIKWAARASSEQGATSMTEVEEQFDYLDNMLKTSLHPETIPNHSYPSQTCHH